MHGIGPVALCSRTLAVQVDCQTERRSQTLDILSMVQLHVAARQIGHVTCQAFRILLVKMGCGNIIPHSVIGLMTVCAVGVTVYFLLVITFGFSSESQVGSAARLAQAPLHAYFIVQKYDYKLRTTLSPHRVGPNRCRESLCTC